MKHSVDMNPVEFNEGVEAGRNSADDTRIRKARKELDQELTDQGDKKEPVDENTLKKSPTPLFMRGGPEGNRGNDQDEKDEAEE